jgi:hypothetical protein
MIIYRLLTMISLTVLHTMTENLFITRDNIDVNVGKRVRLDCELNDTIINGNRKVKIQISFFFLELFIYFLRVYGYV